MPVSRTDDLRFASWLEGRVLPDEELPSGFAQCRQIALGPGGDLSRAAMTALVDRLGEATPRHLRAEVSYGLWTGHPGLWGGAVDAPVASSSGGGRLIRMTLSAAATGSRISAFGARQQAIRRQWWDELLHRRLGLGGRDYLLFRGPLAPVTHWEGDGGRVAFRHCPDLIWPDDHSWLVMSLPERSLLTVSGDDRLAAILDADPVLPILR